VSGNRRSRCRGYSIYCGRARAGPNEPYLLRIVRGGGGVSFSRRNFDRVRPQAFAVHTLYILYYSCTSRGKRRCNTRRSMIRIIHVRVYEKSNIYTRERADK